MKLPDHVKGYAFAFIATVAMANVYVFSKAALNELNLFQFGFYWFGLAIIYNAIYGISAGTAAVMTPGTKLCSFDDAERIYKTMKRTNGINSIKNEKIETY